MTTVDDSLAERCTEHGCCIRVPRLEASSGFSHLAGEWHLRWFPDDHSWFLVPPLGNVREVQVDEGTDPTDELSVDGVLFDHVRLAIHQNALFPPC